MTPLIIILLQSSTTCLEVLHCTIWLCRKRERGLRLSDGEAVEVKGSERPFKRQRSQVDIQAFTPYATPVQLASGRLHNQHRCIAYTKCMVHHFQTGQAASKLTYLTVMFGKSK